MHSVRIARFALFGFDVDHASCSRRVMENADFFRPQRSRIISIKPAVYGTLKHKMSYVLNGLARFYTLPIESGWFSVCLTVALMICMN